MCFLSVVQVPLRTDTLAHGDLLRISYLLGASMHGAGVPSGLRPVRAVACTALERASIRRPRHSRPSPRGITRECLNVLRIPRVVNRTRTDVLAGLEPRGLRILGPRSPCLTTRSDILVPRSSMHPVSYIKSFYRGMRTFLSNCSNRAFSSPPSSTRVQDPSIHIPPVFHPFTLPPIYAFSLAGTCFIHSITS